MVVLRIFKTVWFLSLIATAAVLLYGYASLHEQVGVYENGTEILQITRDAFFYIVLGFIAMINVLVFVMAKIVAQNLDFRIWFFGLIVTFNIFVIVGVSFVALYNSGEVYDYRRLEAIIYGSIALFSIWTVGWPFYMGYKRFLSKS
ncbi:MAG TPA: hypothetical protein VFW11_16180 [Cyclobacteriaceae bacterium]|nr:hypothetical protein [Cyclobacteriaceae bacterium]